MSSKSKYWMSQARFGIVIAIGMVFAFAMLASGRAATAAVIAAATLLAAALVYLVVDRPRARGLTRAE